MIADAFAKMGDDAELFGSALHSAFADASADFDPLARAAFVRLAFTLLRIEKGVNRV